MTDVDWELVFRWFGNECTPAERERFERWLAEDPQHRLIVEAAVSAAGRTLDGTREPARLPRHLPRVATAPRPAWLLPMAASIAIVLGGGLLL